MIHEEGYERVAPPDVKRYDAVVWWFVAELPHGALFARGGRVRRARTARDEINRARDEHERESERLRRRPTHRLDAAGALEELSYR